jgi:hypothetical protein
MVLSVRRKCDLLLIFMFNEAWRSVVLLIGLSGLTQPNGLTLYAHLILELSGRKGNWYLT